MLQQKQEKPPLINPATNKQYFSFMTDKKEFKKKPAPFRFKTFSQKQKQVLTWWHPKSPVSDADGIICDGAVRSGKTVGMAFSYIEWATSTFDQQNFSISGKTIASCRRNVITDLKKMLAGRGYRVKDHRAHNMLSIAKNGRVNHFYVFGGKDEGSQDLIQGITTAGAFFDEVALMPESFVTQATARCSVSGSKFWFNCNPAGPFHWFKVKYIDQLQKLRLIRLHFTMDDNLSLDEQTKERYKRMYSGIFYQRFIRGLWVMAEGVVYDLFDKAAHVVETIVRRYSEYYVSIDYGTQNPMTFGLWGLFENVWYKVKEYHYDGRAKRKQKTDSEYSKDLKDFLGKIRPRAVIVDPSATSFKEQLRRDRFIVQDAKNAVAEGISNLRSALSNGLIKYNDVCIETFKEFASYVWDPKYAKRGEDVPMKDNDHQLDADRYFVNTILFRPKAHISSRNMSI